jgi:multiple sugar transport system permease protein
MILYLTGLTAVNRELVEAARLDGARSWQILRYVILPQLRPVNFIVVMVCVVSALRSFDLVMIMTLGGPYDSSTVLAYYMFEQTFTGFRYGYGAAIGTVLFMLTWACIAAALWRMLRGEAR